MSRHTVRRIGIAVALAGLAAWGGIALIGCGGGTATVPVPLAPPGAVTVSGQVQDTQGAGVDGVAVQAAGRSRQAVQTQTATAGGGFFALVLEINRTYALTFSNPAGATLFVGPVMQQVAVGNAPMDVGIVVVSRIDVSQPNTAQATATATQPAVAQDVPGAPTQGAAAPPTVTVRATAAAGVLLTVTNVNGGAAPMPGPATGPGFGADQRLIPTGAAVNVMTSGGDPTQVVIETSVGADLAGQTLDVFRLDETTGQYVDVGDAVVAADGSVTAVVANAGFYVLGSAAQADVEAPQVTTTTEQTLDVTQPTEVDTPDPDTTVTPEDAAGFSQIPTSVQAAMLQMIANMGAAGDFGADEQRARSAGSSASNGRARVGLPTPPPGCHYELRRFVRCYRVCIRWHRWYFCFARCRMYWRWALVCHSQGGGGGS